MPLILYPAIACGCYFDPAISLPALTAAAFLICSFDLTIASFRRTVLFGPLFDAALFAGTALLIESRTIVYTLLLPVASILFKKNAREWIVMWAGFLLPSILCSYIYWGMGYSFGYTFVRFGENLTALLSGNDFPPSFPEPLLLAFWAGCATATVLALITFWKRSETMRTRAYKTFVYFLWILLFSALLPALPGRSVADFPLLAAPLAVVIPAYFSRHSGWIANLVYVWIVGSIVCYNVVSIATR